jgi:hypothetical protein
MSELDLNNLLADIAESGRTERVATYTEMLDDAWVEFMEEQHRLTSYGFDW